MTVKVLPSDIDQDNDPKDNFETRHHNIKFVIEDTGIGISGVDLQKLFKLFSKLS